MNEFSLSFLHTSLVERNAFIYHGAGIAKGVGSTATNSIPYIDRLKNVINDDLEVCCSTIRPGDSEFNRNYWGRIGLILQPRCADSITLVSASDAGTTPDPDNPRRRLIQRSSITSQALVDSMDHRKPGDANEWCVLNYEVAGVFIEPPIQYAEGQKLHEIGISDVFANFQGFRVFAFNGNSLCEVLHTRSWGAPVGIMELYPEGRF